MTPGAGFSSVRLAKRAIRQAPPRAMRRRFCFGVGHGAPVQKRRYVMQKLCRTPQNERNREITRRAFAFDATLSGQLRGIIRQNHYFFTTYRQFYTRAVGPAMVLGANRVLSSVASHIAPPVVSRCASCCIGAVSQCGHPFLGLTSDWRTAREGCAGFLAVFAEERGDAMCAFSFGGLLECG